MAMAVKISRDLATVAVTKSPKAGPPLIFSISLGSPENDGPDEAEGEPGVPVHDVVRPHVLQVHPLLVQEAGGGGALILQQLKKTIFCILYSSAAPQIPLCKVPMVLLFFLL
jgi:hypothetical protein